jgi:uncharacterized repeat protein (TIGR04138 family)
MSRGSSLGSSGHKSGIITMDDEKIHLLYLDPRYSIHAYQFVMQALKHATTKHYGDKVTKLDRKGNKETPTHVTGQQLCHAAAEYAAEQYGFLAYRVLKNWGIETTGDIGELVYNMIEQGHMQKSPSDNRADFDDVFDMREALEDEFCLKIEAE